MDIRNNLPQTQPSFQATMDIKLAAELRKNAAKISRSTLEQFDKQLVSMSKWGDGVSEISESTDLANGVRTLVLNNDNKSFLYSGSLPMTEDNNLLSSFLNLRKKDILNAEKEIEKNVSNNRLDVIAKACEDDAVAERITGEILPSDEKLAEAIDQLSEREMIDYRFGLNNKPTETGNILDFLG